MKTGELDIAALLLAKAFDHLMQEAAKVIDAWIVSRL